MLLVFMAHQNNVQPTPPTPRRRRGGGGGFDFYENCENYYPYCDDAAYYQDYVEIPEYVDTEIAWELGTGAYQAGKEVSLDQFVIRMQEYQSPDEKRNAMRDVIAMIDKKRRYDGLVVKSAFVSVTAYMIYKLMFPYLP